jgi:hypothetical protein
VLVYPVLGERLSEKGNNRRIGLGANNIFPEALAK